MKTKNKIEGSPAFEWKPIYTWLLLVNMGYILFFLFISKIFG